MIAISSQSLLPKLQGLSIAAHPKQKINIYYILLSILLFFIIDYQF